MTLVTDNIMTTGMSGMFGNQVVFRQRDGRTIAAKKPRKHGSATAAQEAHKKRFLKAVDYARKALADPELKAMYEVNAGVGATAYNMAVADALTAPVIEHIETQGYTSAHGGMIMVSVYKKFRLRSVSVRIALDDGTLLEKGEAVQVNGSREWQYTPAAPSPVATGVKVTALATDLPGNTAEFSVTF